ncbi:hypothetical protein KSP39_PZI005990 [Platanthera zijinensis]|uniref:Retrotransposon gag domain-containing protein n=1 Tax=Platanthera zijinensis TaxID=2320716 RepID=A0AAP0BU92_9ASPA
MQGRAARDLVAYDPEIERTLRAQRRAAAIDPIAMGDQLNHDNGVRVGGNPPDNRNGDENEVNPPHVRTMRDYTTPTVGSIYPGFGPAITNQQFEIKPAILNIIRNNAQFSGMATEDAHLHLADFSEICATFRYAGIPDDTVKLRLFPFSLRDKAKSWLHSLPPGTATTWDALTTKFLAKFHPVDRIVSMRRAIANFRQNDQESLAEVWERFNELLRKCPNHGFQTWNLVESFYFSIEPQHRAMIDAASGGTIMNLAPEEALRVLQDTATHSAFWTAGRNTPVGQVESLLWKHQGPLLLLQCWPSHVKDAEDPIITALSALDRK